MFTFLSLFVALLCRLQAAIGCHVWSRVWLSWPPRAEAPVTTPRNWVSWGCTRWNGEQPGISQLVTLTMETGVEVVVFDVSVYQKLWAGVPEVSFCTLLYTTSIRNYISCSNTSVREGNANIVKLNKVSASLSSNKTTSWTSTGPIIIIRNILILLHTIDWYEVFLKLLFFCFSEHNVCITWHESKREECGHLFMRTNMLPKSHTNHKETQTAYAKHEWTKKAYVFFSCLFLIVCQPDAWFSNETHICVPAVQFSLANPVSQWAAQSCA